MNEDSTQETGQPPHKPSPEEIRRVQQRALELEEAEKRRRAAKDGQQRHRAANRRRASFVNWPVLVALLLGIGIGWALGREHLKYEIRQTMSQAADTFRKSMADALTTPAPIGTASESGPAPEALDRPPPQPAEPVQPPIASVQTCLELSGIGARTLDRNEVFTEVSWRVEIANTCDQPLVLRVTFRFLDDQDFELDTDSARTSVPPNDRVVVSGRALISPAGLADRIHKYQAVATRF